MPPILPANLGLVTIRHLQEEDHFAYVALEKDAEVKMYVSGPTTKTDEEMLGDLRGYRPAMTVLTIAESTSNKFIGRCGLLPTKNTSEEEIFCLLAKSHWRKGVGEIVVSFLARVASQQGKIGIGIVDPGNRGSLLLLKKLGWVANGTVSEPGKQFGHLRYVQPSAYR